MADPSRRPLSVFETQEQEGTQRGAQEVPRRHAPGGFPGASQAAAPRDRAQDEGAELAGQEEGAGAASQHHDRESPVVHGVGWGHEHGGEGLANPARLRTIVARCIAHATARPTCTIGETHTAVYHLIRKLLGDARGVVIFE